MFTPPPSPLPPTTILEKDGGYFDLPLQNHDDLESTPPLECVADTPTERKRTIGRRIKWAVLLVPLALVLITTSTRFLAHPRALDILSPVVPNTVADWGTLLDWTPHKRHSDRPPFPRQVATTVAPAGTTQSATLAGSSSAAPTPTATTGAIPTIPSAQPLALPTPFPQPFDGSIDANFSSASCEAFFLNMTAAPAFRECRPFSLLQQSSSAFTNAQTNLTLLDAIVWGTCNTDLSAAVCTSNMAWFASALQSACAADIKNRNAMATGTLQGLQAFPLMLTAGCLADQDTDTYCYVEATQNQSPSDLYFYQLPMGLPLPNGTQPSCSSCVKSLMGAYASALHTDGSALSGLKGVYQAAAAAAEAQCGAGYAQATVAVEGAAANGARGAVMVWSWPLVVLGVAAMWSAL